MTVAVPVSRHAEIDAVTRRVAADEALLAVAVRDCRRNPTREAVLLVARTLRGAAMGRREVAALLRGCGLAAAAEKHEQIARKHEDSTLGA